MIRRSGVRSVYVYIIYSEASTGCNSRDLQQSACCEKCIDLSGRMEAQEQRHKRRETSGNACFLHVFLDFVLFPLTSYEKENKPGKTLS